MGQLKEATPDYIQVNPAKSFDFTNPFGLILGQTTCAELATSLRYATWESSPEGASFNPVLYDSQWYGWVKVLNSCFSPHDTIENLNVIFVKTPTNQSDTAVVRGLLSAFANRLTVNGGDWKFIYKNPNDKIAPRVVVYKNNASISMKIERDFLSIAFRSHRFSPARHAEINRALVKPVGVAVGISTCHEASIELDGTPFLKRSEYKRNFQGMPIATVMDTIEIAAKNPGRLYPGATSIEAVCDDLDDKVETLYIGIKDGLNNSAARDVYRILASKYKRLEGAQIPEKGAGYARFETSGVTVELKAWGDGQDFLLTYMESQDYDKVKNFRDQKRRAL